MIYPLRYSCKRSSLQLPSEPLELGTSFGVDVGIEFEGVGVGVGIGVGIGIGVGVGVAGP